MLNLTLGITKQDLDILYSDPGVKNTGNDISPASPITHPLAKYISVFKDNVFVGAFLLIDFTCTEIEAHCYLLPKALKDCRKIISKFLTLVFENPNILRVTGWVYEDLKTAINCFKKAGFVVEGVKRSATIRNNKLTNIILMGLTREDFEQ